MPGAADFFRRLQRSIPQLRQEVLDTVIKTEAERFHAMNFRKGGFTDTGFRKWKGRERSDKNPKRRALLVKSGAMKRHATTGRTVGKEVQFVFPLAYMRVHNGGGKSGRGKGFNMPKRQYVGRSRFLEKKIGKKAALLIRHRLNKL